MTAPTSWLCLFNATTWQEFCDAGGTVMGFPETRCNTIKRIKRGDYLRLHDRRFQVDSCAKGSL